MLRSGEAGLTARQILHLHDLPTGGTPSATTTSSETPKRRSSKEERSLGGGPGAGGAWDQGGVRSTGRGDKIGGRDGSAREPPTTTRPGRPRPPAPGRSVPQPGLDGGSELPHHRCQRPQEPHAKELVADRLRRARHRAAERLASTKTADAPSGIGHRRA
jgi:hypothetical protein